MDIFDSWIVNKYIAHRGLHDDTCPENSLSAAENAILHDYAIECDVHPLLDGTPVVFHDDTLTRMTGHDGYITQIKNVQELKTITLKNSNETIPTLRELLQTIDGRVPLLIEIKDYDSNSKFEKAVFNEIKDYKGEIAVMSFNPFSMKWFKENAPEIPRGQLSCLFKGEKINFFKKFVLKRMMLNKKVSNPDFIAYKYDEVPNRFTKKFGNLPLLVWAVPSQSEYMKVAGKCDNIIFEGFSPRI